MKVFVANLSMLGKIPIAYRIRGEDGIKYISDFVKSPKNLYPEYDLISVIYPWQGSSLYVPVLDPINNEEGNIFSIEGIVKSIEDVEIEDENEVLTYLIEMQNSMVNGGVYNSKKFRFLDGNEFYQDIQNKVNQINVANSERESKADLNIEDINVPRHLIPSNVKEVIKEVEVEVEKEIEVEVIKEVEKEVIKEVPLKYEGEPLNELDHITLLKTAYKLIGEEYQEIVDNEKYEPDNSREDSGVGVEENVKVVSEEEKDVQVEVIPTELETEVKREDQPTVDETVSNISPFGGNESELDPNSKLGEDTNSSTEGFYPEEIRIPENVSEGNEGIIREILKASSIDYDFVKTINKEGILPSIQDDFIIMNSVSPEEIQKSIEEITNFKVNEVNSPKFLPIVYRYHNSVHLTLASDGESDQQIGTVTGEMDAKMAEEYIEAILESPDVNGLEFKNRPAFFFAKEIERRLCRGKITVKDFLAAYQSGGSLGFNSEMVMALLKYYVATDSPNTLYDNLFLILYLVKLELTLRGSDEGDIEETISHLFLTWTLNERAMYIEDDNNYDEYDEDPERVNSYVIERKEIVRARGQTAFREILYESTRAEDAKFELPRGEGLTLTECLCISSVYNIGINVKNRYAPYMKIGGWAINFREYGISSNVMGASVSQTVLVYALGEIQMVVDGYRNSGPLGSTLDTNNLPDEVKRKLVGLDYNTVLGDMKNDREFSKELSNFNNIVYLKDYDMSFSSCVVAKVDGKKTFCIGMIVQVDNVNEFSTSGGSAVSRYHYLPTAGTFLRTMLENGIIVKGVLESPKDIVGIKPVNVDGKDYKGYFSSKSLEIAKTDRSKVLYVGEMSMDEINPVEINKRLSLLTPDLVGGRVLNRIKVLPPAEREIDATIKMYDSLLNR